MTNQDSIVFDYIKDMSKSTKNIPINDVVVKLSQKISKDKIIITIEKLCDEGYLVEENGMVRVI